MGCRTGADRSHATRRRRHRGVPLPGEDVFFGPSFFGPSFVERSFGGSSFTEPALVDLSSLDLRPRAPPWAWEPTEHRPARSSLGVARWPTLRACVASRAATVRGSSVRPSARRGASRSPQAGAASTRGPTDLAGASARNAPSRGAPAAAAAIAPGHHRAAGSRRAGFSEANCPESRTVRPRGAPSRRRAGAGPGRSHILPEPPAVARHPGERLRSRRDLRPIRVARSPLDRRPEPSYWIGSRRSGPTTELMEVSCAEPDSAVRPGRRATPPLGDPR